MDLFIVNRYLGESEVHQQDEEQDSTAKILEKIKERKKRKLEESKQYTPENNEEFEEEVYEENEGHFMKTSTYEDESDNNQYEMDMTKKMKKMRFGDRRSGLEHEGDGDLEHEGDGDLEHEGDGDLEHEGDSDLEHEGENHLQRDEVRERENEEPNETEERELRVRGDEEPDEGTKLENSEFILLGGHSFEEIDNVNLVLPKWLGKPICLDRSLRNKKAPVDSCTFLDEDILKNLKTNGIEHFFPVQRVVIQWLLKEWTVCGPALKLWPKDICVCAPTGSGKTLAYVLPIVQTLKGRLVRELSVLVIVPTRDLAVQVTEVFKTYIKGTSLAVQILAGGVTSGSDDHKLVDNKNNSKVDIMVATPGRLIYHLNLTPSFSLANLKFLVMDEVDAMTDVTHDLMYNLESHWASKGINSNTPLSLVALNENPTRPQKLFFSATITENVNQLKDLNLFQPRLFLTAKNKATINKHQVTTEKVISCEKRTKPIGLKEYYIDCSLEVKPLMVYYFLRCEKWRNVLCFTRGSEATRNLARLLTQFAKLDKLKINIAVLQSDQNLAVKRKVVHEFEAKKFDVLVCCDDSIRGMDIADVQYVILYTPPRDSIEYIHLVGRTARAGKSGTSLMLVCGREESSCYQTLCKHNAVKGITKKFISKHKLKRIESYNKALENLKEESTKTKIKTSNKIHMKKRNITKELAHIEKPT